MHKTNPKCCNEDSFMYPILISLHYYDISYNPERITKLRAYTNEYDFTDTTANGFEMNNPHVSLEIIDEDRNIVYSPSNTNNSEAVIIKLKNNRYAALKPIKNKYIKLKEILQSFTHKEISDFIKKKIITDGIDCNE